MESHIKTFVNMNIDLVSRLREFTDQGDGYLFHRKTKSVIINS